MAIYNNGFPMSYQQMYPQPVYNPQSVQTTVPVQQPANASAMNNNSISWVQGEAGAKAYPVAAGNTVLLLDSEDSVFYLKSTDMSGMPQPLRIFEFKEKTHQSNNSGTILPTQPDMNNYVTWDKLEERLAQLMEKPKRTTKKEVVVDE